MKNNEENIDKILRDRLNDRTFDGPPQDFLEDLNKRLDERENKGGFFGPWNGVLDVLLILLFLIYPFIEGNNVDQQSQLAEQSNQEQRYENIEKEENKANIESTQSRTGDQDDHNTASVADGKSTNANLSSGVSTSGSKIDQSNNPSMSSARASGNDDINSGNATDRASVSGKKGSKSSLGTNNQNGTSDNANPDDEKPGNQKGSLSDSGNNNIGKEEEKTILTNYSLNNSNVYASQYPMVEPKIRKWDFPPIMATNVKHSISNNDDVSDPSNTVSPFGLEVQLSSGLNFPRLTTDKGINGSELALNDQTGLTPSITIGGRVTMWWNNISLTTGADYLSVKEENIFEFNEIETYDSTYVSDIDTTATYDSVNQQWDTTYTYYYDSTTVTDTSVNMVPVNQQYSWLQVPLQVGYRFQFNKWAIIPRAGINLAIGIRQTDKTYPNEAFDQLQSYPPTTKVLLNISGSLEVRRQFGNWHIFARGDYQSGMRPILTGDYFERRYNGFRANVGIGLTIK